MVSFWYDFKISLTVWSSIIDRGYILLLQIACRMRDYKSVGKMFVRWKSWRFNLTNMLSSNNVRSFISTKERLYHIQLIRYILSNPCDRPSTRLNANRPSSTPIEENDSNLSSIIDETPLGLISTIGCGTSIVAILVMIFIFVVTSLNDSRHIIHMNLGGAILGQK